jgi:hypothetical protein
MSLVTLDASEEGDDDMARTRPAWASLCGALGAEFIPARPRPLRPVRCLIFRGVPADGTCTHAMRNSSGSFMHEAEADKTMHWIPILLPNSKGERCSPNFTGREATKPHTWHV